MKKYKIKNKQEASGISLVLLYFPTNRPESSFVERYISFMYPEDMQFLDIMLGNMYKIPRNK